MNTDFEWGNGSTYAWAASGTYPSSVALSVLSGAALTGHFNGRGTVTGRSTGQAWACVNSGANSMVGKTRLYVNVFVRSNMTNITLGIYEYNSSAVQGKGTASPSFTPTTWTWHSFIESVGTPWYLPLQATTNNVSICVIGSSTAADPDYLDIDSMTMWAD